MCVGIPAKITAITPGLLPMAQIDLNGELIEARLAYFPDAEVGDYVLVQNGFVMDVLDEQSAAESLAAFAALGVLTDTEQPASSTS